MAKHAAARIFRGAPHAPGWLHALYTLLLICGLLASTGVAVAAIIDNTASVSFIGPFGPTTLSSNTTSLNTLPSSPSTVTFYQYAPGTSGSSNIVFDGGLYDNSGSGTFVPLSSPQALDGTPISLASPVEVRPTDIYHVNEPVFITLADANRNIDPLIREYIDVTLTTTTGDAETLRMQETGPSTGIFAAVIPSVDASAVVNDYNGLLSVDINARITVNYQDLFYPADTSTRVARIDPVSILFSSATGAPVNGASITLIDNASGLPATVLGDDGVSSFPATVVTGSSVTDSGGQIYTLPTGGFRFPIVQPGNYRFLIVPPTGYATPSVVATGSLPNDGSGNPYTVITGSRGEVFVVPVGLVPNIDIPADAASGELFLQKLVSQTKASAGDFLQYRLVLKNNSTVATSAATLTDRLPAGMRYQAGSLRLNGQKLAEPTISNDGRTLTFSVSNLAAGATAQINYVVLLTAGVVPGEAVNTASAQAGVLRSNVAQVVVHIRKPLFSDRFTIIGRIYEGDCNTPWNELKGVPNARVMLEDGSYAVTDKDGQYHFEGVRPGTHVVQLDVDSLPTSLEPVSCIDNTRFAGRSFSQFVDVKGGSLWRADFHTRARSAEVGIRLHSELDATMAAPRPASGAQTSLPDNRTGALHHRIEVDGSARVNDLKIMAMLPEGSIYEPGSTLIDGEPAVDPTLADTLATFRLENQSLATWTRRVEFRTLPKLAPTTAPIVAGTPSFYTVRARFDSCSSSLTAEDAAAIEALAVELRRKKITRIELAGHTDNRNLSSKCRQRFADNRVLSKARAQAVGDALLQALGLRPDQISAIGRGADMPLTSNSTEEGRASNRRVEVVVYDEPDAPPLADTSGHNDKRQELFASCSAELLPEDRAAVELLMAGFSGQRIDRIELIGHTDNQVPSAYCQTLFKDNYALSQARAQTLGEWMAQSLSLHPDQVTATGRGADVPVATNRTAAGRALNRRIEIVVHRGEMLALDAQGRVVSAPAADNRTPEGRAENRRADLIVHTGEQVNATGAPPMNCPDQPLSLKALAGFTYEQKNVQTPPVETTVSCSAANTAETISSSSSDSTRKAVAVSAAPRTDAAANALPPELQSRQRVRRATTDDVTASGARQDWLTGQTPGAAWVFPGSEHNSRAPAVRIAIKHAPDQTVVLKLPSGEAVSGLNFDGTEINADRTVAVSIWRGVPLTDGANLFKAEIRDAKGVLIQELSQTITYANSPIRAVLVPEQSILIANGIHRPVLAVRFLDREGQPVRAGVTGPVSISAPYRSWQEIEQEQKRPLAGKDRFSAQYFVEGDDGIAYIELAPTTESGVVQLNLSFQLAGNSSRRQELRAWLEPEARDWVVVGFAEGTVGYNTLQKNTQPLDGTLDEGAYNDGQVSLYAKGRVLGKWLLTMAFDSDKPRSRESSLSLLSGIDPDEYYTLYGDGTEQRYDAPSQDKLYLKLERGQFYALFGDYYTGLTQTQLSRYSRTLNGIKSEYGGGPVVFTAYAAETPQNLARDEIQGNGTSGLYRLSQANIVLNSEQIRIETRDRLHSEKIIDTRSLTRHIDYDIDYSNGTLFFRQPIASRDASFNPIFIVAEYETLGVAAKQPNAGGRIGLELKEGKMQAGVTGIHNEDNAGSTDLMGADFKLRVGKDSEIRVETAQTQHQAGSTLPQGSAWLAEFEHHTALYDALLYSRRQEPGFGLNQQNFSEAGQQKVGAESQFHLGKDWSLLGQLYQQENLGTLVTRDAAITKLLYETLESKFSIGVQTVTDRAESGPLAGQDFRSDQATLGASRWFMNRKLELSTQVETSLASQNASIDYPDRYLLGAGYDVTNSTRLLMGQEFTDGSLFDASNTRAGFQTVPWKGSRLNSTLNQGNISEYGPRTFSQMGLTQAVLLDKNWGLDFSLDSSQTLSESREPLPVVNSTSSGSSLGASGESAPSINTLGGMGITDDFIAISTGATYRSDLWSWNGRAENRNGETSDRYGIVSNFLRQAQAGVAFASSAQIFSTRQNAGGEGHLASLDLSWAWRPLGEQWSILDRMEFRYEDVENGVGMAGSAGAAVAGYFADSSQTSFDARSRRVINNFALNRVSREWKATDQRGNLFRRYERNQLSLYYGAKYALDTFDGVDYSGYTDLYGIEVRHDITHRLDVGIQASSLNAWSAGNHAYSIGPMVGFSPVTNGWITLGWNFRGFSDRDFDAARYTAQGPYLQLRFKFDQDTEWGKRPNLGW